MSLNRRVFIKSALATVASASVAQSTWAQRVAPSPIKAVAFDAFPVFDPRPIFKRVQRMFPKQGSSLNSLWRTRQFEYQWLRALSQQYQDFWQATGDALWFAAESLKVNMTDAQHAEIMDAYLHMNAWPDVQAELDRVHKLGIKMCFLANMTHKMLHSNVQHAGLGDYFDLIISTDGARTYKPDAAAYQLGPDTLKLSREQIVFVAFAGWDVAGAKWYGYPTLWINRLHSNNERLGMQADRIGSDLNVLTEYLSDHV